MPQAVAADREAIAPTPHRRRHEHDMHDPKKKLRGVFDASQYWPPALPHKGDRKRNQDGDEQHLQQITGDELAEKCIRDNVQQIIGDAERSSAFST